MRTRLLFFIIYILALSSSFGRDLMDPGDKNPGKWCDSVLNELSLKEKIAQLIMVPAWSERGAEHEAELIALVQHHGIGGIAFFQGGPVRQINMINHIQAASKVPVLMALDAEWGLGMRLDSTMSFPYQVALGALRDDDLIYRMGREIGKQLKAVGIQMNFAPVVDVNINPKNPVINYRSFGSDPLRVASKGIAYMKGLQDEGIITTAKHFPGHGDTQTDSHLALPVINHDLQRLKDVELLPFEKLIENGLKGIMVAHLNIPALDPEPGIPTTLSKQVVSGLLRKEMGFKGLIVTDALNMKGVSGSYPPGELEVRAFMAGNDILVYVQDVKAAIEALNKAAMDGRIDSMEIKSRCRKVLMAKYQTGLSEFKPVDVKDIQGRLFPSGADVLKRELTRSSLTVLNNNSNIMPVKGLAKTRIASVSLGAGHKTSFQQRLSDYTKIDSYFTEGDASPEDFDSLRRDLENYDLVILGLHDMDMRPAMNFGISPGEMAFLSDMASRENTIISIFGNPYSLGVIPGIEKAAGLILAYYDNYLTRDYAAQLIFGGISANGILPVDVNDNFKAGSGLQVDGGIRFSYILPEEAGIDHIYLKKKIDSICQSGIDSQAYPGCEVFAARNGQIFFHECYGFQTYENDQPVTREDIYDLASVTKVTGPLPALIRLYEEGKIDLDAPFSDYWPRFRGTDKEHFTVREGLAHYARLAAWIPYYREARVKEGPFSRGDLRLDSTRRFSDRISEDMFVKNKYREHIFDEIAISPLLKKKEYVYSGLLSYIYPEIVANKTGRDYEEYLYDEFFRPLGAWTLVYNPLRWFPPERIVPTENDDFFRMQQLRGYVHDEGAALMGGVSGNAGLFSTAEDLAKLHQMYLWEGEYGGERYLSAEALKEFIRCQYCDEDNRRGLGFDKPLVRNDTVDPVDAYPCHSASPSSFGHSGYTGTLVWADPENGLLFVFLSNRVYPTRENSKLYDLNIRSGILETLYIAIENRKDEDCD
jgi:beta-glucosidase-like glycosyl hydrolase/CubicO group peptidase (beta-lactamase class C family)